MPKPQIVQELPLLALNPPHCKILAVRLVRLAPHHLHLINLSLVLMSLLPAHFARCTIIYDTHDGIDCFPGKFAIVQGAQETAQVRCAFGPGELRKLTIGKC